MLIGGFDSSLGTISKCRMLWHKDSLETYAIDSISAVGVQDVSRQFETLLKYYWQVSSTWHKDLAFTDAYVTGNISVVGAGCK